MNRIIRFSELSPPRQALVRVCQRLNFGSIQNLRVTQGDPVFDPPPTLLIDQKLGCEDARRPELDLSDFGLPAEVCDLADRLDRIGDGILENLEVRAGIPRRVVFQSKLTDLIALDTQT